LAREMLEAVCMFSRSMAYVYPNIVRNLFSFSGKIELYNYACKITTVWLIHILKKYYLFVNFL